MTPKASVNHTESCAPPSSGVSSLGDGVGGLSTAPLVSTLAVGERTEMVHIMFLHPSTGT
jgi:hypothetical protein